MRSPIMDSVQIASDAQELARNLKMQTDREELTLYLKNAERTAKELAALMKMRVHDVLDHLEHVHRKEKKNFKIRAAECTSCHFVFEGRKKMSSPGRCPHCRSERIVGPWISIKE